MSAHYQQGTGIGLLCAAFGLAVAVAPTRGIPEDLAVSRLTAGVRPAMFTGTCPAHLTFTGTIVVTRQPVMVEYQWERSDGARSTPQRIEVHGRGHGVTDTWALGAAHSRQTVWEKLHVLSPNSLISGAAVAHINCR